MTDDAANSGYRVFPDVVIGSGTEEIKEQSVMAAEIIERGYRPFVAGDMLDENLDRRKARVLIQVGAEHLARIGGAETGDMITAGMVNRGLLAFLRGRDRFGTGRR